MAEARNAVLAPPVRSLRACAAGPLDSVTPLANGAPLPARRASPANRQHRLKACQFVKRPSRGFTLLEVMVALMIVAFALTALSASMNQMIDAANTMRDRTYASWIAQNKIAELRLANEIPEVSTTSGDVEFGNMTWEWDAVVSETGIENFMRVDVSVSYFGEDYVIQTVTGFIGEPVPINWGSRIYQ